MRSTIVLNFQFFIILPTKTLYFTIKESNKKWKNKNSENNDIRIYIIKEYNKQHYYTKNKEFFNNS